MRAHFTSWLSAGSVRLATFVVVIGMCVFVVSTALAQKEDAPTFKGKKAPYAALVEAPKKARERRNPFEGDAEAVATGGKLFERHCAECHGANAEGSRKAPSLLGEEVRQATPGTLFWILTNGVVRQGMPVWSKLPEQQRWQLVTFLRSLDAPTTDSQSPKPDPP